MTETKKRIQELTKAELEIMQVVWKIGHEFVVRDVHELLPDPRPAYSTVSTIVRILDTKGFLSHKTYGHSNVYQAAVSKEDYTDSYMHGVLTTDYYAHVFGPAEDVQTVHDRGVAAREKSDKDEKQGEDTSGS